MPIYVHTRREFARMTMALMCSQVVTPMAQAQQSDVSPPPIARLIVKLHTPADQATVMQLIRQELPHPERLTYLRSMSGDAHVLSVVPPATQDTVPILIDELRATKLFEYVELDRMMTIRDLVPGQKATQ
jgi:hypothetical protein